MRTFMRPGPTIASACLAALLAGCAGVPVQDNTRKAGAPGPRDNTVPATRELVVWRGSLTGGLAGALTGGALGRFEDRRDKEPAQTYSEYGYTSRQGDRLSIDFVRVYPAVVAPGETIALNLDYAVLLAAPDTPATVTEVRSILKDGVSVARVSIDVAREAGTWHSTLPVTLPKTAPEGNYQLLVTIEAPGGLKDSRETFFKVAK